LTNYKKILSYLSYFENGKMEFGAWTTPEQGVMGYYNYDKKLKDFFQELYKTDLLAGDYLLRLEEAESEDYGSIIPSANLELLKAILTFYVRGERFSEGMWRTAAKNKLFYHILLRLRELDKESN
jgi:hypothetical protein